MTRQILRHLAAWFGAAAGAIVLAVSGSALAQQAGGTLVMAVNPEPSTLASYLSTSGPIGQIAPKVYEGLLEYDFSLNPKPGLARSWDVSSDGLTMTFRLQEGVRFHDGSWFTSADVRFSIMEVLKKVHPRGPNTFKEVVDIATPDAYTVVFHLRNAAPYLIRALSGYESPMLPKHLFENSDLRDNPLGNAPIGTGPYRFVEWERGEHIRLERNPDYWKPGLPYLDGILVRFMPDPATRAEALETGKLHFAAFGALPNADAIRLRDLGHIGVTTQGYSMINPMALLEIDTTRPPFDKKEVRQAIAHAIDRKFIVDNIWSGFGRPATGPISSNFRATGLYTDKVVRYDGDNRITIANELLDEAGYTRGADGIRFRIIHDVIPFGEEWVGLGEYIKQALGEIGIAVELRHEDLPAWLNRIYTNFDFTLNSNLFYQLADPVLGMHRQYLTSQIRKGTVFVNASRYSNSKIDSLLDKASKEPNSSARARLYDEIQRILVDDVPVIPLFEMEFVTVYNRKFHDLITGPLGAYGSFDGVWLEE
jgi:peptide/nickel transport system substrate-binding protein